MYNRRKTTSSHVWLETYQILPNMLVILRWLTYGVHWERAADDSDYHSNSFIATSCRNVRQKHNNCNYKWYISLRIDIVAKHFPIAPPQHTPPFITLDFISSTLACPPPPTPVPTLLHPNLVIHIWNSGHHDMTWRHGVFDVCIFDVCLTCV